MLSNIIDVSTRAGARILELRRTHKVDCKDDGSPVTDADLAADAMIREALERSYPSIPIISEESPVPPYETRRQWERFWLIDPLDGTREFVSGSDEFTVNVALIERGEPVLGVLYAPAVHALYYAEKGKGAFKRMDGEAPIRIHSKKADPKAKLTAVTSRSHCTPELESYLKGFTLKDRIYMGSSLKFGCLSEGRADFYPRFVSCKEWDVAAGDCIYRSSRSERDVDTGLTYNKPDLRNGSFVIGF